MFGFLRDFILEYVSGNHEIVEDRQNKKLTKIEFNPPLYEK